MAALCLLAAATGCDRAAAPAPSGSECAAVRELGTKSLKRWKDAASKGPAPDAPLSAAAEHSELLAKTAREIGAEFAKAAPKRTDLAEAAEGAKMLGDLAAVKLEALARTVRALEAGLAPLGKLESTANDAVEGMGKDIAGNVGCSAGGPAECAAVEARVRELDNVRVPPGFAEAAKAARARADTLDGLAKAVEALPAAPPKQKAREETARRGREGATALRALSQALDAVAPAQERLGKDRQDAEEAAARLTAELTAAGSVCSGAAPAGSGKSK